MYIKLSTYSLELLQLNVLKHVYDFVYLSLDIPEFPLKPIKCEIPWKSFCETRQNTVKYTIVVVFHGIEF